VPDDPRRFGSQLGAEDPGLGGFADAKTERDEALAAVLDIGESAAPPIYSTAAVDMSAKCHLRLPATRACDSSGYRGGFTGYFEAGVY